MKILVLLALVFVPAAACSKDDELAKSLATVEKEKDKFCKCADQACANEFRHTLAAFVAMADGEADRNKPTEVQASKLRALKLEIAECKRKLGYD